MEALPWTLRVTVSLPTKVPALGLKSTAREFAWAGGEDSRLDEHASRTRTSTTWRARRVRVLLALDISASITGENGRYDLHGRRDMTERSHATEPDVRVCADARDLSERAAAATVEMIGKTVRQHGRCSLVLSGGNTPKTLYRLLASTYRDQVPWSQVHVFWGDERFVPHDDPASNYRMARESLLDHVPLSALHIHPMPTQPPSPDAAARDYERTLRTEMGSHRPLFDLVLLGLGEDGHTASLFPRSPALNETTRWVVAVTAPVEPFTRLTLTLPAIASAARIFVLVSGARKANALEHVLSPAADPDSYPAASLRLAGPAVTWWIDRNARAPSRS